MRDYKYLLAYIVPAITAYSFTQMGAWSWATVYFVFVVVPILEWALPTSTANTAPEEEAPRSSIRFFDWLLYSNALILYGIVGWYLYLVALQPLSFQEWLGLTLSAGLIVGAEGINVAHELGHRNTIFEQNLAKFMLMPALYQHFFIEHNRGHHKNVATDLDPASARRGELVFSFWWRSISGSWLSAWALERARLDKMGQPFWSAENMMLRFQGYQLLWLLGIYTFFGTPGLLGAVGIALIGVLLLETVNYLEHYGLRRRLLSTGHYEPVGPAHSWNSNHEVGRILLYELTRHSDHHFKSTRKYQILRHIDESPQLPFGYPTAVVISLVPPLWFAIMHRHLDKTAKQTNP
jgi:alkane 1-monooxygenase